MAEKGDQAMIKGKWLWVTKDKTGTPYELWDRKPYWRDLERKTPDDWGWDGEEKISILEICSEYFKAYTGFHLKPGPEGIARIRFHVVVKKSGKT